MKRLYILRHAKAELGSADMDDHDRPLAKRGLENAASLALYLQERVLLPEQVLCSTALRTRQTIETINKHLDQPIEVSFTDALYLADAGHIIKTVQSYGNACDSLMIVGHNPGLHHLCLTLAADGNEEAMQRLTIKFPTCALAMIDCDIAEWGMLESAVGYLTDYLTRNIYSTE